MFNSNNIDLFYLNQLIKNKDITSSDIEAKLSYSRSYIYDVLKKRRNFSYAFFDNVIKKFNIEYHPDDNAYTQCYEIVISLAIDVVKLDNRAFKQKVENYRNKRDYYVKSRGFVFVSLIDFIISHRLREYANYDHMIEVCYPYFSFYDDSLVFVFLLYFTFTHPVQDNFKVLSSFYDYCLTNYKIDRVNDYIKGFIYFQLGKLNTIKPDFFLSYKYFHQSMECFKNVYLINRVIECEVQIGCLYADMLQVEKAIGQLEKCLNQAIEHNLTFRKCTCYNNLSFLYFYQGDYDKAKEYIRYALDNGSKFTTISYMLAYISIMEDPKSKSRSLIKQLIDKQEDLYDSRVLKLIQALLNNNEEKLPKYYELTVNMMKEINNTLEIRLIHKMIINYLEKQDKLVLLDKYKTLAIQYLL